MSKKILPALVAVSCLASLPALADNNKIIGFDGLGQGGYALINPGTYATEASGIITLVPGTGASDGGIVTFHIAVETSRTGNTAPPNCTFSPAQQFETTAHWSFPSQFTQYGKDPATGNVTVEWRTGAPLVAGQQYLIVRVCAPKATNPPAVL
jgi:hypothetical protein